MTMIFLTITLAAMLSVFGVDSARKRREYLRRTTETSTPVFRFFTDIRDNRMSGFTREAANYGIK